MKELRIYFVLVFGLITFNLQAQDLDRIGEAKPIIISGGVSVNQIFYATSDTLSRRDPYTYFATGNLNFDLYGWSVPLSYTFSNQKGSFHQPFNQYGIHPRYKWLTTHLGYGSMSYSPYTLSGHLFLGGGVEVEPPGMFKFSAMYGRLQKGVSVDTAKENPGTAAFQRMGFGFKASMIHNMGYLDLIMFRAKDDINSIHYIPDDQELAPQENLVFSLGGGVKVIPNVDLKFEAARSAITEDTRVEENTETSNMFSIYGSLYTPRYSSAYYNAFKTNLSYNAQIFTIGVGYERIDPGYRTLGAYYFNNDLENATINFSSSILQNKVSLSTNVGLQRDNLDDQKMTKMQRVVSSINLGFMPTEKLNMNIGYSNFYSYTHIRPVFEEVNQITPYDNLDTLDFTQISENANFSANYAISSDEQKRQHVNLNVNYQVTSDQQQGQQSVAPGSKFYNVSSGYNYSIVPINMSFVVALNFSHNSAGDFKSTTLGPTLGVNKSFLDRKLRANFSSSLNNSYSDGENLNRVMNYRLGGSYKLKKKHNFNLSMVLSNRKNVRDNLKAITDFTATLGYSFNF